MSAWQCTLHGAQLKGLLDNHAVCPRCRTHSLGLAARHGTSNQLTGMRNLLASLGAAVGDQLCFRPAGSLAAEVSLLKAAVAPAAAGGGPPASAGAAAQEQHFVDADEVEEADAGMEEGEAYGEDEAADVAMAQEEWEEEEEEPQLPLQQQQSLGISAAGGAAAAGGAVGRLPGQAVQQEGAAAVWAEMRQLLEAAEEQGEGLRWPGPQQQPCMCWLVGWLLRGS